MTDENNPPTQGDPVAGQRFPPPGPAWSTTPDQPSPPGWSGSSGSAAPPGAAAGGYLGPTAVRPGIIPLRPLSVGDILDGAFRVIRFNPRTTLGLSFAVSLVTAAVSVGVILVLGGGASSETIFRFDPSTVVSALATVVLTGLLTHVVAEAVLGRKATIGESWAAVKDRVLPLLGYQILFGLVVVVLVVTIVGILALPLLTFWVLAPAVIVLERQGIRASMRRSAVLVSRAFWRTLGVLLLVLLILMVTAFILVLPVALASGLALAAVSGATDSPLVVALLATVGTLISSTLLQPFASAAVVLLYVDRRMRLEGLDVTLARSAQGMRPPGG